MKEEKVLVLEEIIACSKCGEPYTVYYFNKNDQSKCGSCRVREQEKLATKEKK